MSDESRTTSQRTKEEIRNDRFGCIAGDIVENLRDELTVGAIRLRSEERSARKMHNESHAEEYRQAGNAVENAIAELEELKDDC